VNVPKIGVMFSDCNSGFVTGARIEGNFPSASFTGTETGHAGILIDAPDTGREGSFQITECDIATCVQGVLIANYGAASRSQGIIVANTLFHSCWNHGVYAAGSVNNGAVVDGNSFIFCQVPVALAGAYHTVVGNSITTGGSTGAYTDIVGISMRDPEQCVVSNNVIQGETGVGQVVIALTENVGTTVRKNIVSNNTLNITGSGSSIAIRIGSTAATNATDNIVSGNVCSVTGVTSTGLIAVTGASSCVAHGSIVADNTIVAKSASYGVIVSNCTGVSVTDNKYRLEFDAGSAVAVAAVRLASAVDCDAAGNTCTVTASWGTNITVYGVWEGSGCSGNYARANTFRVSPTKVAASIHYNTLSGSGIIVHDTGADAPNLNAGVGSTWSRTNGGAGTSFYVKESGTDATGWVGK
jgi:parallel beta-helix repeat protein